MIKLNGLHSVGSLVRVQDGRYGVLNNYNIFTGEYTVNLGRGEFLTGLHIIADVEREHSPSIEAVNAYTQAEKALYDATMQADQEYEAVKHPNMNERQEWMLMEDIYNKYNVEQLALIADDMHEQLLESVHG